MDTPIYDELVAAMNAELDGGGFWPDYYIGYVLTEQMIRACVDAAVATVEQLCALLLLVG